MEQSTLFIQTTPKATAEATADASDERPTVEQPGPQTETPRKVDYPTMVAAILASTILGTIWATAPDLETAGRGLTLATTLVCFLLVVAAALQLFASYVAPVEPDLWEPPLWAVTTTYQEPSSEEQVTMTAREERTAEDGFNRGGEPG